jgi:crossover junction endodeoxyribonuclease RuvC
MLRRFLSIPQEQMLPQLDATDGLAAAYCHFLQMSRPVSGDKKYSDWKDFVNKNKGIIVQTK